MLDFSRTKNYETTDTSRFLRTDRHWLLQVVRMFFAYRKVCWHFMLYGHKHRSLRRWHQPWICSWLGDFLPHWHHAQHTGVMRNSTQAESHLLLACWRMLLYLRARRLSTLPDRRHTGTLLDHRSKRQYFNMSRTTRKIVYGHAVYSHRTKHFLTSDCIKCGNDRNIVMFLNQHKYIGPSFTWFPSTPFPVCLCDSL